MLERTRRRCLEIRNRRYPEEQWPEVIYERRVAEAGGPGRLLVEIGCGREALALRRLMSSYAHSIGIDVEIGAECADGEPWELIPGDAHALPLQDESVDVIGMANVAEHLEDPVAVFTECKRILRPGGKVIVLTVNKLFPPIVLGRLLPHSVRQMVNRFVSGTAERDTFPTFYRANCPADLKEIGQRSGLSMVNLCYVSRHPCYFLFSVLAYRVAVYFEEITRRRESLRVMRNMIQVIFERPVVVPAKEAACGIPGSRRSKLAARPSRSDNKLTQ